MKEMVVLYHNTTDSETSIPIWILDLDDNEIFKAEWKGFKTSRQGVKFLLNMGYSLKFIFQSVDYGDKINQYWLEREKPMQIFSYVGDQRFKLDEDGQWIPNPLIDL